MRLTPRAARWLLLPAMLVAMVGLGPVGADAAAPISSTDVGQCGEHTLPAAAIADPCSPHVRDAGDER